MKIVWTEDPRTLELAEFSWNSIVIKEELGSGTFGSVYFANFNIAGEPRCVVVKKSNGDSAETKQRFEKEAWVLDSVKGHKNIARFLPRASGDHDGVFLL